MKYSLYIIVLIFVYTVSTGAQEQVIPDPYLTVVKKGGTITISQPGGEYSFSFPGDTVFRIMPHEIMLVKDGDQMGVVDPWDLCWMAEPEYSFIGSFDEETILVKKKGKYLLVNPFWDGFDHPYIECDTLYPFTPQDELVYNDMNMYIVKNKGKYGLYNTWQPGEIFIPVKFNEIVLLATHTEGIVYKMRKGKKWGAGDCETYETEIAYDEIDWLCGSCANNYFRVEVDGKSGLVSTWSYKDYVYPPEFDKVSFVGEWIGNGYFILKKDDKWDVVDDSFPPFQPRYDNVHILETEGLTRISMETDSVISTLEISEQ